LIQEGFSINRSKRCAKNGDILSEYRDIFSTLEFFSKGFAFYVIYWNNEISHKIWSITMLKNSHANCITRDNNLALFPHPCSIRSKPCRSFRKRLNLRRATCISYKRISELGNKTSSLKAPNIKTSNWYIASNLIFEFCNEVISSKVQDPVGWLLYVPCAPTHRTVVNEFQFTFHLTRS